MSFSLGAALPAAIARFLCFLLYRFLKYIPKPINQARKTIPPHMLPAIIGVLAFFLEEQGSMAGWNRTLMEILLTLPVTLSPMQALMAECHGPRPPVPGQSKLIGRTFRLYQENKD